MTPSALTATTFSEPKITTWTQLLPSSALSRWAILTRPPLPELPSEANIATAESQEDTFDGHVAALKALGYTFPVGKSPFEGQLIFK